MDLTTSQWIFFSKTKMSSEEHLHSTWTSPIRIETILHFTSKHISSHFELIFLMPSIGSTNFTLTYISSKSIKTRFFHLVLDQIMFLSDFKYSTLPSHSSFRVWNFLFLIDLNEMQVRVKLVDPMDGMRKMSSKWEEMFFEVKWRRF